MKGLKKILSLCTNEVELQNQLYYIHGCVVQGIDLDYVLRRYSSAYFSSYNDFHYKEELKIIETHPSYDTNSYRSCVVDSAYVATTHGYHSPLVNYPRTGSCDATVIADEVGYVPIIYTEEIGMIDEVLVDYLKVMRDSFYDAYSKRVTRTFGDHGDGKSLSSDKNDYESKYPIFAYEGLGFRNEITEQCFCCDLIEFA